MSEDAIRWPGLDEPFDSIKLEPQDGSVELSVLDSRVTMTEAGLRWLIEVGGPAALEGMIRRRAD